MADKVPSDPDQWEHRLLLREGMDELLGELDNFGTAFWELAQVMRLEGGWAAMLKRPIRGRDAAKRLKLDPAEGPS